MALDAMSFCCIFRGSNAAASLKPGCATAAAAAVGLGKVALKTAADLLHGIKATATGPTTADKPATKAAN